MSRQFARDFSLQAIEIFSVTVDAGSEMAAAARLGISQPAISKSLARLEGQVGVPLLTREGGRLTPTAEGLRLYGEVSALLGVAAVIAQRMSAIGAGDRQRLRLIAPPGFAAGLVADAISLFAAAHPDIDLSLAIGNSAEVVRGVAAGAADLGLSDLVAAESGVRLSPVARTQGCVLLPPGHRLGAAERVTLRDLADEVMVAFPPEMSTRRRLDAAFRRLGLAPRIRIEVASVHPMAALVRSGVGCAILNPLSLGKEAGDETALRPLAEPWPYLVQAVLPGAAPPSPAARRFAGLLRLAARALRH